MNRSQVIDQHPTSDLGLGGLIEELTDRLLAGEHVDFEAVARDHPRFAHRLRDLLPCMAALGELSRSARSSLLGMGENGVFEDASPLGELGDYRIIREVGRGGMGVVYEAEQMSLGRPVALKVLPFAATLDPRHLQRFKNEARAAASLHHDHVVPVYGVGEARGIHYYAMQFVDGCTLSDLIRAIDRSAKAQPGSVLDAPRTESSAPSQDPVSDPDPTHPEAALSTIPASGTAAFFRRAAELGGQAADALEHAHAFGVVHRDVKPGNLLIDHTGKLWVSDFGLAKLAATDGGVTISGDVLGTLRYMSPEQALAKHDLVDHRTDIYALGASLYELLSGRPAVEGKDREEVLRKIAFEEPPPPRNLDRSIPVDLESIVLKCLRKEPSERYATAGELANDLRRFMEHMPVQAKRPTQVDRMQKWARRHHSLVKIGLTAIVLALCVLTVATALIWRETQRTKTALAEKERALERARARTKFAQDAADSFYGEFANQWLEGEPHKTPQQLEFLKRALQFYEELSAENGDDPVIRAGAALAVSRVGRIRILLGQLKEAEPILLQAAATFRELLAADTANIALRLQLADCLTYLGGLFREQRRAEAAIDAFAEAFRLLDSVAGVSPNRTVDWALARNASNLGVILKETGKVDDGEQSLRSAVVVAERVITADPNHLAAYTLTATARGNLGGIMSRKGKADVAESEYREGIRILDRSGIGLANDAKAMFQKACLHNVLGANLANRGRFDEATKELDRAVSELEQLRASFPDIVRYSENLAYALLDNARVHASLRKPKEAETTFLRAIEVSRDLVKRSGDRSAPRESLADACNHFAHFLLRANRPKEADAVLSDAVAALEGIPPDRRSRDCRSFIGRCLFDLGATSMQIDRRSDAERAFRRAIDVWGNLATEFPGTPEYQDGLARSHNSLGTLFASAGDIDAAFIEFEAAVRAKPGHPAAVGNLRRIWTNRTMTVIMAALGVDQPESPVPRK